MPSIVMRPNDDFWLCMASSGGLFRSPHKWRDRERARVRAFNPSFYQCSLIFMFSSRSERNKVIKLIS